MNEYSIPWEEFLYFYRNSSLFVKSDEEFQHVLYGSFRCLQGPNGGASLVPPPKQRGDCQPPFGVDNRPLDYSTSLRPNSQQKVLKTSESEIVSQFAGVASSKQARTGERSKELNFKQTLEQQRRQFF